MDKKILVSMMVIGLVATLAGAGLYAYFSDTETTTENKFQAGTLDITLYDAEGNPVESAIWTFTNLKPGDVFNVAFIVENTGSLTVSDIIQKLYITADTESDGTGNGELDEYLGVLGFWVGVVDTKADAVYYAANPPIPGPDPDFNDYTNMGTFPHDNCRYLYELVAASQDHDIDITDDGNVPGQVLPTGKFLVYIYQFEFWESGSPQNDAQGDILELTMELTAKQ